MIHLCIFCGSRVNSAEHVWPQWLLDFLKQMPGKYAFQSIRVRKDGQVNRWPEKPKNTPDIVTKCVCEVRCNNGWMSDLEKNVKPILSPMNKDEKAILDTAQQSFIVMWMLKTAMIFDRMFKNGFYDESERFHFRKGLRLPAYNTIVLGRYTGTRWGGFTCRAIVSNKRWVPHYRSYVLTMALGSLALQLCTAKFLSATNEHTRIVKRRKGPWSTVELLPTTHASIRWPPIGPSLNDSEGTLEAFSKRFGGTRIE